MKIISLVPSITETLFDFGLNENEIIGRTKFCIHPKEQVSKIEIVGGTKNINIEKVKSLNPDLIIANKEENEKSQVKELMKDFRVWVTDIETLEDNEKFLSKLGKLLNKKDLAYQYNQQISEIFKNLSTQPKKPAAYLIWQKPYMTVGKDTFIHEILSKTGFKNIFENEKRYPTVEISDLKSAKYVFLSTEPYPFKEIHKKEFETLLPNSKIIIVDGEAFSWYGTHLTKMKDYFNCLTTIDTAE